MTTLTISRTHYPVEALGPGRRFGVWVQGCGLVCRGCLAKDTWDPGAGSTIPVAELLVRWQEAFAGGASGVTVSGGEPLDQPDGVAAFLAGVRETSAVVDVLVYTGYELPDAQERAPNVLALTDGVLTGRFDITRPTRKIWRGSANQRLVLLTDIGIERFGPYVDLEVDTTPVQYAVTDERVWFIGVPRIGDLATVERRLRDEGFVFGGVTWRS